MTRAPDGERRLIAEIASRIRDRGALTFAEFMQIAMQHPSEGYYARGAGRIGRAGDYITSPEVSSGFGACLARQIVEMDRRLGAGPFVLVEPGSGTGRLAADILEALEEGEGRGLLGRLTVILVEASAAMRAAARERLGDGVSGIGGARIRHAMTIGEAAKICGGAIRGAVVSNEFFDALPVRLVLRRDGRLLERKVGLAEPVGPAGDDALDWLLEPADDPDLLAYAERYGAAAEEGYEAEIGLRAVEVAAEIARTIEAGYHIVVDYGHPAAQLYGPRHPRGTLLAYSRHRTNEEFLRDPGGQDLTAHVNFTAISDAGRQHGLETAGLTSQDRFLLALGLAERIVSLAAATDPESIRRRLALMSLIHPEGMGRTFSVLVQSKGVSAEGLAGLADPYRDAAGAGAGPAGERGPRGSGAA